jgi:hypothetical protein
MQWNRVRKYLLSFRKRTWDLGDYPVEIRAQTGAGPAAPAILPWRALIAGWPQLTGLGATREAAYADLAAGLEAYKASGEALPRPGARVHITLAPHARVYRYPAVIADFFPRMFDVSTEGVFFISDGSSLGDFVMEGDLEPVFARIEAAYGVDVRDVEDGLLAPIFERIAAARPDLAAPGRP